ncbi:hypothetical protein HJC23_005447 [Cyclotella cryptica]|uniref:Peptidase M14 domain-containing protein n=1 Tax=Cyclotella cryptica TaxID=29204 RepID=A0ABD3P4C9_9STRA|eukprot:CCRYP_017907-RA/>CCRYP_017907-RA protein AED:0.20 eAED:0.20 QI:229/1/1/1/1/1/2/1624/825
MVIHEARVARSRRDSSKEEQYEILPSSELLSRMLALSRDYPTFVTLTTTQEWFGLPRAGTDADCPFDQTYKGENNPGCNNYVLIIQDKEAYPDDPDVQLAPNAEFLLNQEGGWWKEPPSETEGDESGLEGGTPAKSGWKYIPDVFLSGSVHGDERVGPTSLLEMAELVAEAAYCESMPRMKYKPKTFSSQDIDSEYEKAQDLWQQELMASKTCRQSLDDKGVPSPYRQWLARLASTRRIVIIPTANALGYSRNKREEDSIDPNRDFPFDIQRGNEKDCMQTIAGRSINELFRSHLFPIGLTFHGGMEVIGYEWGAPTYLNKDAPDAVAQDTIANAYSRYANGFPHHSAYDYGTMNDKVYYVRGGMEDWAFAGSWDPERVVQCSPTTYGGYPSEKTQYNNSTLRAFNMLIETSDIKGPPREQLGKRNQPLISSNGEDNGHIARNIRLALLAVDTVEPYVSIKGVGGLHFDDDVVPAMNQRKYNGGSFFETTKMIWVPESVSRKHSLRNLLLGGRQTTAKATSITWTVGGSFNIDSTEIIYGPWDKLPENLADARDGFYPSRKTLDLIKSSEFRAVPPSNIDLKNEIQGRSRWHKEGAFPVTSENDLSPTFEALIDLSTYPSGTTLAVFAKAKVDKSWLNPASNVGPAGIGSVSHIVNSRTNPLYFASNGGKVIQGREENWWYSAPITIIIGSIEDEPKREATTNNTPTTVMDGTMKAVHVNARMGNIPSILDTQVEETTLQHKGSNRATAPSDLSMPWLLGALASLSVIIIGCVIIRRRRRHHAHRQRMERIAAEENEFSVDLSDSEYHDDVEDSVMGSQGKFSID